MSAIAGIVRFSGEAIDAADLVSAAKRMTEPGLLDAQYWTNEGAGFLIRQSLYTAEDSFERQPWISEDEKLVLVYDGRLDNRDEVAAALGIPLKNDMMPDGLLLLRALERWGEGAPGRLIGDFVFALWNRQSRRMMLARDQMGGQTLYYHQGNGFIAFASSYPALLALPGVPKKIDELGIADFLTQSTRHHERTFYEKIRRMPSASIAIFDNMGLRFSTYWNPEPKKQLRLTREEEYVEAAREHMERAVARRMRAKGPIGAQISGGLDSSAVASAAARLMAPNRLFTVCSVPPEGIALPEPSPAWYNDERPYVKEIAELYPNMDLHLASSSGLHCLEEDPVPFFEAGGIPARSISNVGWFIPGYEMAAKAGVKVLLTGEGGNFAWSNDGLIGLSKLFKDGRWLNLAREIYLTGKNAPYGMDWKALLKSEVFRPFIPPDLLRLYRQLKRGEEELWSGFSSINPAFARDIGLYERTKSAAGFFQVGGPADNVGYMIENFYRIRQRRDMHTVIRTLTGIENRAPLTDIRLLEFFLSLPQEQFLQNGVSRRLAKRALSDRLPPSIIKKEKIGMQNPEIRARMGTIREGLHDEIAELEKVPLAARCVDLPRLGRIVREWPTGNHEVNLVLPQGLNVARFLRWTEQGN